MFWKKPSLKHILPPPVKVDHAEYSMILSMHDEPSRPSPALIDISLKAIRKASKSDLADISARVIRSPVYPDIWPGEHYKLLAGLTTVIKPGGVIEIGTATGLSALCIKKFLPRHGKITTFDIVPWRQYPNSHLKKEDFEDGALVQHVADLSDFNVMKEHQDLFMQANLIFIDATHDGTLEKKLLENFQQLQLRQTIYLVFDDIRVWTMLRMWREIPYPKIDLTSFGHWSGTGLVEFSSLQSL